MTHTSTEQAVALRLADIVERLNVGVHSQAIAEEYSAAARELRRLHARVQELEAAQAQRAPLAMYQRDTIKANAWRETVEGGYYDVNAIIDDTEAAHGITQEKQG